MKLIFGVRAHGYRQLEKEVKPAAVAVVWNGVKRKGDRVVWFQASAGWQVKPVENRRDGALLIEVFAGGFGSMRIRSRSILHQVF